MPGQVTGTSHYSLAANFFESAQSVRSVPDSEAEMQVPRTTLQHALQAPISYSMAFGTVAATVGAIVVAVATFGA